MDNTDGPYGFGQIVFDKSVKETVTAKSPKLARGEKSGTSLNPKVPSNVKFHKKQVFSREAGIGINVDDTCME